MVDLTCDLKPGARPQTLSPFAITVRDGDRFALPQAQHSIEVMQCVIAQQRIVDIRGQHVGGRAAQHLIHRGRPMKTLT